MLAKDSRYLALRQSLNVVLVGLEGTVVRNEVLGQWRHLVVRLLKHIVAEELCHVDIEESAVPVVCDAPSVGRLGDEVLHGVPRSLVVGIEVALDDELCCIKVGVVEVVGDIPAQSQELASLQQHRVKEAEREQEALVWHPLLAFLELLLCHVSVQALQVGLEPFRGLCGHLDPGLQNRDRELGIW